MHVTILQEGFIPLYTYNTQTAYHYLENTGTPAMGTVPSQKRRRGHCMLQIYLAKARSYSGPGLNYPFNYRRHPLWKSCTFAIPDGFVLDHFQRTDVSMLKTDSAFMESGWRAVLIRVFSLSTM